MCVEIRKLPIIDSIRGKDVFILERCQRQKDVRIREMSVLERCQYQRDVSIREKSVLERCLYQRDVSIREMFELERCQFQREVSISFLCARKMSISESHTFKRYLKYSGMTLNS